MFKKYKKLHETTVARQLFSNYVLLFLIVIIIILLAIIANSLYTMNVIDKKNLNQTKFYQYVKNESFAEALKNLEMPEDAYMELLDTQFRVINSHSGPHKIGYQYEKSYMINILFNNTLYDYTYYLKSSKKILLIHVPQNNYPSRVIMGFSFTILTFAVLLILSLLLFAKFTAKNIISPINELVHGVKMIGNGNYDYEIHFKSKNELELLRLAINHMTEQIKKETALKEASENKRKQLILDITHDIKTPLTNIQGYCETLSDLSNIDDATRNRYLEIIRKNSDKANTLVVDLFELSQFDNLDYKMPIAPIELSEFMRQVFINFIPSFEQKNMEYDVDIPDSNICIMGNEQKLERAFNNLISNSIKYSGDNTIFSISLHETDTSAVIIIKDNGIGIPKNMTDMIFEPFIRIDPSRNKHTGGTGLGLSITKKIVEKHNGDIVLSSQLNKGCSFKISLPRCDKCC